MLYRKTTPDLKSRLIITDPAETLIFPVISSAPKSPPFVTVFSHKLLYLLDDEAMKTNGAGPGYIHQNIE